MTFEKLKEEAMEAVSLEELFSLWKKAHIAEENYENTTIAEIKKKNNIIPAIEQNSFIADGYVSQYDYEASAIKVLFILREANIAGHRENDIPDQRTHKKFYGTFLENIKNDNPPKQKQKMARMAYYLQHPELSEEERKKPDDELLKNALKSCGYMNINKRGGGATVNWEKFYNYFNKYRSFIIRQKEIMSPNHIVFIGPNSFELFSNALQVWHTSYRMKGKKRCNNPEFSSDKNVDCYMKEFFRRAEERGI